MLKKKCPGCAKKIERKFNFCPWCNHSFKKQVMEEDFGMLGNTDEIEQQIQNELKLPFGMNAIFNGLMKQLEKELGNMNNIPTNNGKPRGFKIQISTGKPQIDNVSPKQKQQVRTIEVEEADETEKERRLSLDRIEAKSTVRRLPEGLFYEIDTPGVKSIKDVVITKLENSMEIKVYAEKKCYIKNIPLKLEIVEFSVKPNKVLLRLNSN